MRVPHGLPEAPGWQSLVQAGRQPARFAMVRPTPSFHVVAAGIHWRHSLRTDHAPMVVDCIGAISHAVPEIEVERQGRGVAGPVP